MMSVSYFRLPVPQRAITKPLVWRLWKENRLVVRHAAMIRDYWVSSFSRSQSGCNMCKVSFADNSETVGHTGIARLCCSQRTARTRTDCLLLQEEACLFRREDVTVNNLILKKYYDIINILNSLKHLFYKSNL